jgi:CheY-like chemotaxis protein
MSSHLSLLIVEDNSKDRNALTKWFVHRGHAVTAVHHPRQALEAATISSFDVALLDQSLPEQPGLQLMSRLRGLVRDLRVVLLSGDPDDVTSEEALQQGANGFLHKPCSLEQVDACVTQVMSGRSRSCK